jgi:hypothetical protein
LNLCRVIVTQKLRVNLLIVVAVVVGVGGPVEMFYKES